MGLVLMLFILIGFVIGKKYSNKNVFSLIFGFIFLTSLLVFLPVTYDLLSVNYHAASFLYVLLLMVLGATVMMILDSFKIDNDFCSIGVFYFFLGLLVFGKSFSLSYIVYAIFNIFMGMFIKSDGFKKVIGFTLFSVLGLLLGNAYHWMFGYVLGIMLGMIAYYIVSKASVIIKNKEKSNTIFLLLGMVLAFLLVIFK